MHVKSPLANTRSAKELKPFFAFAESLPTFATLWQCYQITFTPIWYFLQTLAALRLNLSCEFYIWSPIVITASAAQNIDGIADRPLPSPLLRRRRQRRNRYNNVSVPPIQAWSKDDLVCATFTYVWCINLWRYNFQEWNLQPRSSTSTG